MPLLSVFLYPLFPLFTFLFSFDCYRLSIFPYPPFTSLFSFACYRLKAVEVINHPLFWNSEMRLSFLRDASDRVELEKMKHSSQLLQELESKARVWDGGKWDKKIGVELQNDLMHPHHRRPYNANSVRGLLRLIRNKFNHYGELKEVVKAELGPLHEGFDSYFSTRFPKLLIEVYQVFLTHCAGEEVFQKYFRSNSL